MVLQFPFDFQYVRTYCEHPGLPLPALQLTRIGKKSDECRQKEKPLIPVGPEPAARLTSNRPATRSLGIRGR
jgi:hypothetical protein